MPQMAPIYWFFLFLIFSTTLLMFNFINYYCFLPSPPTAEHKQSINQKSFSWKW
uniref:ATP synthase complex subunit 8 n=1 Tax=Neoperla camerunensis TaxID=3065837 RepID=A0AA95Z7X5_9NEOP|nr:ATPase subunit 8 [Neoperla camerunensis]